MTELKEYLDFILEVFSNGGLGGYIALLLKSFIAGALLVTLGSYFISKRFPKMKFTLLSSFAFGLIIIIVVSSISFDFGTNVLDPNFNFFDLMFEKNFQI